MKNIFLLIIFSLFEIRSIAAASFEGMYYFNINPDITCFIDFFKDNTYVLTLWDNPHGSDINIETNMSCGKFLIRNKMIYLSDTLHGFRMKIGIINSDSIKIEQGFAFMQNKVFLYRGSPDYSQDRKIAYNIANQEKERKYYGTFHKILYPFVPCVYESENNTTDIDEHNTHETGLGYEIRFRKEKKYQLFFKNVLISDGIWERNSNELSLKDINLNYKFYLLIGKNGLISKYLPGDFTGIKLNKKKSLAIY